MLKESPSAAIASGGPATAGATSRGARRPWRGAPALCIGQRAIAGVGVGMVLSLPIGVGLTALELIVILVQAYVFTLLTAVFIGMAIHAHH